MAALVAHMAESGVGRGATLADGATRSRRPLAVPSNDMWLGDSSSDDEFSSVDESLSDSFDDDFFADDASIEAEDSEKEREAAERAVRDEDGGRKRRGKRKAAAPAAAAPAPKRRPLRGGSSARVAKKEEEEVDEETDSGEDEQAESEQQEQEQDAARPARGAGRRKAASASASASSSAGRSTDRRMRASTVALSRKVVASRRRDEKARAAARAARPRRQRVPEHVPTQEERLAEAAETEAANAASLARLLEYEERGREQARRSRGGPGCGGAPHLRTLSTTRDVDRVWSAEAAAESEAAARGEGRGPTRTVLLATDPVDRVLPDFPQPPPEPAVPPRPKLCAITGAPARYKDPVTNLRFASMSAFVELRRKHEAQEEVRLLAQVRTIKAQLERKKQQLAQLTT